MKITNSFMDVVRSLYNANKHIMNMNHHIPKMVSFQKFVQFFIGLSNETKIKFAAEFKRRLIRQQIIFTNFTKDHNDTMISKMVLSMYPEIFKELFRRMSYIDGSINVPLTNSHVNQVV